MTPTDDKSDLPPGISAPAHRALASVGIETLEQCAARTASELLKLHGMGPKAMSIISSGLANKGLSFADSPTLK